jgi:hypothetical protein
VRQKKAPVCAGAEGSTGEVQVLQPTPVVATLRSAVCSGGGCSRLRGSETCDLAAWAYTWAAVFVVGCGCLWTLWGQVME